MNLAISIVILIKVILAKSNFCSKDEFIHYTSADAAPGPIITSHSVAKRELCERTCRLYLECTAYRITQVGQCDLMTKTYKQSYISAEDGEIHGEHL